LGGRKGIIIFFCVTAVGLPGCQQDDEISQLIEESPFNNSAALDNPADILIVTCQFCPLELPGHVDITGWPFWEPFSVQRSSGPEASASGGGFPPQQIQLWQENGFLVGVVPMARWSEVRQMVLRSGGRALSQSSALIRRSVDIAEFNAYWLDQEKSIYVSEGMGAGRALTLSAGSCVFAVNCIPGLGGRQAREFHIKIVPEVQSAREQARIDQDESGGFRRIQERPKILFDHLMLSGTIPRGHFLVIAGGSGAAADGKLGSVFLRHQIGGLDRQLIVVIAPEMQTGTRIKSDYSNRVLPK
jgi:hypothetical protein